MGCKPIEATYWTPLSVYKLQKGHFFVNIILVIAALFSRIIKICTGAAIYTSI
jgi:hypothetical protein